MICYSQINFNDFLFTTFGARQPEVVKKGLQTIACHLPRQTPNDYILALVGQTTPRTIASEDTTGCGLL